MVVSGYYYIVSGCLAGVNCRFDGDNNYVENVEELVNCGVALPVCPEVLGDLPIPRERCELQQHENGDWRVMSETAQDRTVEFLNGAKKTLAVARNIEAEAAVLKENSPSCGVRYIYDGTFSGNKIKGSGVTCRMLQEAGIKVFSEKDFD